MNPEILEEGGQRVKGSVAQPRDTWAYYLMFLSLLSRKRPRMLTARTYGRQRLGVRKGAACSFSSGDCVAQGAQGERRKPENRTCLPGWEWVGGAQGGASGKVPLGPQQS